MCERVYNSFQNFYHINMPQAGFDPPAQSEVCFQTTALPPSHHGWTLVSIISTKLNGRFLEWQPYHSFVMVLCSSRAIYQFFLGSTVLPNSFFLCWDRWNGDVTPTLDAALLSSSRAGADLGRESGLV